MSGVGVSHTLNPCFIFYLTLRGPEIQIMDIMLYLKDLKTGNWNQTYILINLHTIRFISGTSWFPSCWPMDKMLCLLLSFLSVSWNESQTPKTNWKVPEGAQAPWFECVSLTYIPCAHTTCIRLWNSYERRQIRLLSLFHTKAHKAMQTRAHTHSYLSNLVLMNLPMFDP